MKKIKVDENHLGKAVFSVEPIKEGEHILDFKGKKYTKSNVPKNMIGDSDRFMQIGVYRYLGPSGKEDDLLNHSCDPNSGVYFVKGKVILKAIRDIKPGEEITWDYSTTMYKDDWSMLCRCGTKKCRKIIKGFDSLSKKNKIKYINLNIVPQYIRNAFGNI